jgi:hypothetical protein
MKKYLAVLVLVAIGLLPANTVLATEYFWTNLSGGDFWTPGNWNTVRDGSGAPATFPLLWNDTIRIHSTVVGNTYVAINCPLASAYMVGGIWRNASGSSDVEGNYDLTINDATVDGTGSLVLTRCSGLAYSDYPAQGHVDVNSGTIYITGDNGNISDPNKDNYFRIAHRGTASLRIGDNAKFIGCEDTVKSPSHTDIVVAGSANSEKQNRGYLTIAGDVNVGAIGGIYGACISVEDHSVVPKPEGAQDIQAEITIEPNAVIRCDNFYIAANPLTVGTITVKGRTAENPRVWDLTDGKIGVLFIADYGIGTMNIEPNASVIAKSSEFDLVSSNSTGAIGTLNIEGKFTHTDNFKAVDHKGTAIVNVLDGGIYDAVSARIYASDGNGTGTINVSPGGTITSTGNVYGSDGAKGKGEINSAGTIDLGISGTLQAAGGEDSNGTVNISGGTVNVRNLYASSGTKERGKGTVNISGGTVNVNTAFYASTGDPNSLGTINISGGTVNANSTRMSNGWTYGYFNISGGEFINTNSFTTLAERGTAIMTMTDGYMNINRLVIANFGASSSGRAAVGSATFTGGRADIYSRICIAQNAGAAGTLTIGGTADVNLSDESRGTDWMNPGTSVGIMAGFVPSIPDANYGSSFIAGGDATFALEGSNATVRTPYLTVGGKVYVPADNVWRNSGPARFVVKLDGVHGVGKGIHAYHKVWLNDGPAANTGVVPSFLDEACVGIYNIIKCDGEIIVDETTTGNLMLNSPGWSYTVVDAGEQQRFKLLYCDKGDNSCLVDLRCFAAFAAQWVDGNADGYDLAFLVNNWLHTFSDVIAD